MVNKKGLPYLASLLILLVFYLKIKTNPAKQVGSMMVQMMDVLSAFHIDDNTNVVAEI